METWKEIKGYEGLYEVSTLGKIRSIDREVVYSNGRVHIHKGQILSEQIDNGYSRVRLYKDGKSKRFLIHRIVAETYIPNPNNLPQVDHIVSLKDGGTNSLDNLCWTTGKDNLAKRTGHSARKPVKQYDLEGNYIATFESIADASRKTGINENTLRGAVKNSRATNNFKFIVF